MYVMKRGRGLSNSLQMGGYIFSCSGLLLVIDPQDWILSVGSFVSFSHYTSPRRRLSRSSSRSRRLAGLKGGSPIVLIGGMRMCCVAGSLATLFKTEYTDSALRLVSISR